MNRIFTEAHRNQMMQMLVDKLKREEHEVRVAHAVPMHQFRYCISCGSAIQPCCGH